MNATQKAEDLKVKKATLAEAKASNPSDQTAIDAAQKAVDDAEATPTTE